MAKEFHPHFKSKIFPEDGLNMRRNNVKINISQWIVKYKNNAKVTW
jgi:hypothetical protein